MNPTHVVLLHHPVSNRRDEKVTTSVTNLDIHDIARSCRTYEVSGYHIVTPIDDQRALVERILGHWSRDQSKEYHPDRFEALERVSVEPSFEVLMQGLAARYPGHEVEVVLTEAREWPGKPRVDYRALRERWKESRESRLQVLVFGTGWGVHPDFHPHVTSILEPVYGPLGPGQGYNHLSVRAAAAIILDRLFGHSHQT